MLTGNRKELKFPVTKYLAKKRLSVTVRPRRGGQADGAAEPRGPVFVLPLYVLDEPGVVHTARVVRAWSEPAQDGLSGFPVGGPDRQGPPVTWWQVRTYGRGQFPQPRTVHVELVASGIGVALDDLKQRGVRQEAFRRRFRPGRDAVEPVVEILLHLLDAHRVGLPAGCCVDDGGLAGKGRGEENKERNEDNAVSVHG